jgi:hypothetical protein
MLEVRRTEIEREIEGKKLGLRGEELPLTSKYYDHKFIQALLSKGYLETKTTWGYSTFTKIYNVCKMSGIYYGHTIASIKVDLDVRETDDEKLENGDYTYTVIIDDYDFCENYDTILKEFTINVIEDEIAEIIQYSDGE